MVSKINIVTRYNKNVDFVYKINDNNLTEFTFFIHNESIMSNKMYFNINDRCNWNKI